MEHNGGEREKSGRRRVDKTKGGDKTRQARRRREVKKGKEFLTDRPGGRGGGRGDADRMTALI